MIIALQTLVFFRESIFGVIDRFLRPYYKHFSLSFTKTNIVPDDDESEDHVFAEFDDEKGVVFFPPVYAQRYAAVTDCLMDERWCGKLEKVVDFGYHDTSFIKYLKEIPGIKTIFGVDIECISLRCSSDLLGCDEVMPKRETPLHLVLFQGNAADPDYRLIGCDAVIAIEMIEHMLPHDLERLVHTIFGFIKPWIAVITTPNGDFNPLFKKLEKNGLRRLDHFFEWSREQFYDWCSNIVARYPQYTVSCRGIGPGPPDTILYGCCSQLALFVSKDYHKQQDLNLNSLALVPKAPSNNVSEFESFDSAENLLESNMICSPNTMESYTELVFSNKQSCVTIVLSPTFSLESLEYLDKTAQCNLDKEVGKNFLMFDEEETYHVLVPRRRIDNRVYLIEDVNSRLNCTTFQVKKFSKKTQNLLVKNKMDTLVHKKEVVDEIRHLTKMLNFNDYVEPVGRAHVWQNINWGDNAPYWNQYYKIVKEYTHPFEPKSEECRILDLISDEINRLVDTQYDEDFSLDVDKVEIPIEHLMRVVQHITEDVDMVKDILEWNGYEVVDDVVVHSRLIIDTVSTESKVEEEWRDNDTVSDWENDIHSASFSEGSFVAPDSNGRCLFRALDHKVRKLRAMVSTNQDISKELDRVVCRLMKLALRTTKRRQRPLPNKWMQCKLFDLLSLTEKAIEKKRRHYIETNSLKAICYEQEYPEPKVTALNRIKEDNTGDEIVNKYQDLARLSEKTSDTHYFEALDDDLLSKEFTNEIESSEPNFDIIRSPSLVHLAPIIDTNLDTGKMFYTENETSLSRTRAWVHEDANAETHSDISDHGAICIDAVPILSNLVRCENDTPKPFTQPKKIAKKSHDNVTRKNVSKHKIKDKTNIVKAKKTVKKKSSYNILIKTCSANIGTYVSRSKKSIRQHSPIETPIEPISNTMTAICDPVINIKPELVTCNSDINVKPEEIEVEVCSIDDKIVVNDNVIDIKTGDPVTGIFATKESLLMYIISEDNEETLALRRTIGKDVDNTLTVLEGNENSGSLTNVMKIDSLYGNRDAEIGNSHSQTIFIMDINEPSTSKGVRHVSMDVQCGPNNTWTEHSMLSATTSFTKTNILKTGIKIDDSIPNVTETRKNNDFGTSTDYDSFKTLSPRMKSVGIKIKDSGTSITDKNESVTPDIGATHTVSPIMNTFNSTTCTTLLRAVSSRLKMHDSWSETCDSIASLQKSPLQFTNLPKYISDSHMKSRSKVEIDRSLHTKCCVQKLCYGGVYVHSYKDRQICEDVVYQGEWQKYMPKTTVKKRGYKIVLPKRLSEVANNKNKENLKDNIQNEIKSQVTPIKRAPIRNTNIKHVKGDANKPQIKNKPLNNNIHEQIKSDGNAKEPSKFVTNSIKPKIMKHTFVTKKPSVTFNIVTNENEKPPRHLRKSYIPLYLRRKLLQNVTINNDPKSDLDKIPIASDKSTKDNLLDLEAETEAIKTNLLNFDFKPRENVSYVIFRNEIEINKNSSTDIESSQKNTDINISKKNEDSNMRSSSSLSLNSSGGSSPNSIATVKARKIQKIISDKRHSTVCKSKSQAESGQGKSKKYTKRCKTIKKSQDKVVDNKENDPESSKKYKDCDQSNKTTFIKNKNVFMAQISNDSSPQVTKNKPQVPNKSHIKIPSIPSSSQKSKSPVSVASSKPSVSKERSFKSKTSVLHSKSERDISDVAIISASEGDSTDSQISNSENMEESVFANIVDSNLLTEWINSTHSTAVTSQTSNILDSMRHLIEEKLDFVVQQSRNGPEIDSTTVVLDNEKCDNIIDSRATSYHDVISLNGTLSEAIEKKYSQLMDFDNSFFDSVVYNDYNPVWANDSMISITDSKPTVTDLEMLSFKSLASTSKLSEYFLAESLLTNVLDSNSVTIPDVPVSTSVRDIFERKPSPLIQGPAGALAVQAFSGFSMNAAPITGDKPDRINLIDSETGSVAVDFGRQTTSEELFISGRSSDSYESCLIEDDSVVPNWLFQIISQQQTVAEEIEDSEDLVTMSIPVPEPIFDPNGNIVEPGMGAGAGAGDGHGIHSNNSEDSSGRGTSLSSNDTSSDPQSEAILIDPSTFTTQYDLMRESVGSSTLLVPFSITTETAETSRASASENHRNIELLNSSGDPQIITMSLQATSDMDADISSIGTDAPDSDN